MNSYIKNKFEILKLVCCFILLVKKDSFKCEITKKELKTNNLESIKLIKTQYTYYK